MALQFIYMSLFRKFIIILTLLTSSLNNLFSQWVVNGGLYNIYEHKPDYSKGVNTLFILQCDLQCDLQTCDKKETQQHKASGKAHHKPPEQLLCILASIQQVSGTVLERWNIVLPKDSLSWCFDEGN